MEEASLKTKTRNRKAQAKRSILVTVDRSLYDRLDSLRRGQTVTSLARDLIIQGADVEHDRRLRADVERMLPRRTA